MPYVEFVSLSADPHVGSVDMELALDRQCRSVLAKQIYLAQIARDIEMLEAALYAALAMQSLSTQSEAIVQGLATAIAWLKATGRSHTVWDRL